MAQYFIIPLFALLGGTVQGVTGFGCGIVMMMAFPFFFPLPVAAGVSNCCALALSGTMAIRYRKYISFKKIIFPALTFIAVCSVTIFVSTSLNQTVMKKVFGAFLMILCIYYLFFNKQKNSKFPLPVKIIFVVVSALCDGLFGIGGPLMVLYFLSETDSTEEYLGCIQCFFFMCGVFTNTFRIVSGIVTVNLLPSIAVGIVGILIGGVIGTKIVRHINPELMKKLTYIMIGVAGLVNVI